MRSWWLNRSNLFIWKLTVLALKPKPNPWQLESLRASIIFPASPLWLPKKERVRVFRSSAALVCFTRDVLWLCVFLSLRQREPVFLGLVLLHSCRRTLRLINVLVDEWVQWLADVARPEQQHWAFKGKWNHADAGGTLHHGKEYVLERIYIYIYFFIFPPKPVVQFQAPNACHTDCMSNSLPVHVLFTCYLCFILRKSIVLFISYIHQVSNCSATHTHTHAKFTTYNIIINVLYTIRFSELGTTWRSRFCTLELYRKVQHHIFRHFPQLQYRKPSKSSHWFLTGLRSSKHMMNIIFILIFNVL